MLNKKLIACLAFVIALISIPIFVDSPFILHVCIMIFLYATVGASWNILSGYAGQLSLGQSVFFGVGAYTSSALYAYLGINPWIGMLAGITTTMLLGIAIGLPCFRLQGRYFAIATMAIVQIAYLVVSRIESLGGARGIYLPMDKWGLATLTFRTKEPYYYIAMLLMFLSLIIVLCIEHSYIGYYLKTIREDPDAAEAIGIDVPHYKMVAMHFSTFLAAIAGTFFSQYMLFIDPDSVFMLSVPVMLTAVMGGVGAMFGPLIGAAVLIPIQEATRIYWSGAGQAIDQLIYGLLIIIMVALQPRGIMGMIDSIATIRESKHRALNYRPDE